MPCLFRQVYDIYFVLARIGLLLSLFFCCLNTQAQFVFTDWHTNRSGLSHNIVYCVMQDRDGFIWMGTHQGICRFDGFRFENFQPDPVDDNHWEKIIVKILQTHQGYIVAATLGGRLMVCRDTRRMKWQYIEALPSITALTEDEHGRVWYATREGDMGYLDAGADTTVNYGLPLRSTVSSIIPERQLIGINNIAVIRLEIKQNKPVYTAIQSIDQDCYFRQMVKAGANYFYFSSCGLTMLDSQLHIRRQWIIQEEENNRVGRIAVQADSTYFLVEDYMLYDEGKDHAPVLKGRLPLPVDFNEQTQINDICIDKVGRLWVATHAGLLQFNPDNRGFRNFKAAQATNNPTLSSPYVRGTFVDSKRQLWVGYLLQSPQVFRYTTNPINLQLVKTFGIKETINTFTEDKKGHIWLGGMPGIYRVNRDHPDKIEKVFFKDTNNKTLHLIDIWDLKIDSLGYLWIAGSDSGLYVADPEKRIAVPFCPCRKTGRQEVWRIFITRKSEVFIGSHDGIDSVVPYSSYRNIRTVSYYPLLNPVPRGKHVWNILEDGDYLWAATTDYGLVKINRRTKTSCYYTQRDGLTATDISSVTRDKQNRLWLATLNGLNCFDPLSDMVYTFDESDGTISNDYNFKAAASGPEGLIFLGTKMGLMAFNPAEIMQIPRNAPKAEVVAMSLSGKQYLYHLAGGDTVKLNHKQNFFSFAFALPNSGDPFNYRLRYRLEGFDKDWNEIKASEQAMYTGVPPGEYTLRLQSSVNGKVWVNQTVQVHIHIIPAFWQTTWFRSLLLLLAVIMVSVVAVLLSRSYIRRANIKQEQLRRMAELEMKAVQAQMNPHFVFNAINAIQHFILNQDELTANEYLTRFARLMRLYLESLTRKTILLSEEIDMLQLYVSLEALRFENRFTTKFDIDAGLFTDRIDIPAMLVQPFVENAINHGLMHMKQEGHLLIGFYQQQDKLHIMIDDNGIGREKAAELARKNKRGHRSRAMEIMEERIRLWEGGDEAINVQVTDKYDKEGLALGTRVDIIIPLQDENHYEYEAHRHYR